MEFREITTFLQVAKFKSFSRAAEQLGYTQAAVTIQIKNLEKELGVHLFDRIGKQTLLTHQGLIFYEYASNIAREISQAKDALSNPEELTGTLCLGTIESVCASVFPSLLREYHRRYPKVNIKIITDSPETPAYDGQEHSGSCLFSGQTRIQYALDQSDGKAGGCLFRGFFRTPACP